MPLLKTLFLTLVFSACHLSAAQAQAPSVNDDKQPINIQADQLNASEKAGKSVYLGNVEVNQGSLTIKGDKISVQHPQGKLSLAITTGSPASFKRYNTEEKVWVTGKANRIEYDTNAKTVLLIGNALVEQAGKHQIKGQTLFYDLQNQLLTAKGSGQQNSRVTVTFAPNDSANNTANKSNNNKTTPESKTDNSTKTDSK